MCCGVLSILLGSICSFLNVSNAVTNRGLGVAGRYAYRMGCHGFLMIRIVVFTLFNSRISARVGRFD
jgi:hypothetical protein